MEERSINGRLGALGSDGLWKNHRPAPLPKSGACWNASACRVSAYISPLEGVTAMFKSVSPLAGTLLTGAMFRWLVAEVWT